MAQAGADAPCWDGSRPPPPTVNFREKAVIGFASDSRPSSGYSVRITGIVEESKRIVVLVEEQVPADNCVVLAVMTSPYTFVTVDAGIGKKMIEYRSTVKPISCDMGPNKTMEPTR